jgi:cell division control protein 6
LSVFTNRESLSPNYPIEKYWDNIPHRNEQVRTLWDFYGDVLDKRGDSFLRRLQIIGPAGSGKTCTLKFFGGKFEEEAHKRGINLDHVYVNLKFEGGRRIVFYRNLLSKIEAGLFSMNLSVEEMLRNLFDYLKERKRSLLLTIDEIDYYVRHFKDEGVVYDLTRLNEFIPDRPCGVVGVTFLAREKDFHSLLNSAELSSLGRLYVEFKPYEFSQIEDILALRAEEALRPGTYSDEVVEFIADITSQLPINGDLRYALDLLLYSGNLADNQGSEQILPEHVRRVHGVIYPEITTEEILSLPDEEKIVLLGVVRALQFKRRAYAPLKDIKLGVGIVNEEVGIRRLKGDVDEYIQDLCDRGIIDIKSLLEIGISGVALENLNRLLSSLIDRLQSGLNEYRG